MELMIGYWIGMIVTMIIWRKQIFSELYHCEEKKPEDEGGKP